MADTLGGLIDKLITIDMKMWNNQEFLYKARKMDFKEFEKTFASSSDTKLSLFNSIKKCCDINMQRNQLIDEIDEKIITMFNELKSGKDLDAGKFLQRKHKTY